MDKAIHAEYMIRLDRRKRLRLRGAKYSYYLIKEYDNGCILLEPRELVKPQQISDETRKAMDDSIQNFRRGKVSAPIELSKL